MSSVTISYIVSGTAPAISGHLILNTGSSFTGLSSSLSINGSIYSYTTSWTSFTDTGSLYDGLNLANNLCLNYVGPFNVNVVSFGGVPFGSPEKLRHIDPMGLLVN